MAGNRVDSVQLTTNRMGTHNGQGFGIFGWWVESGGPEFLFLLQTVTI